MEALIIPMVAVFAALNFGLAAYMLTDKAIIGLGVGGGVFCTLALVIMLVEKLIEAS